MHDEITVPLRLNPGTLTAFEQRFTAALQKETTRVIVLVGQGDSFCTGMDLNEVLSNGHQHLPSQFVDVLKRVKHSPKPVIASVSGNVIAGGMALLAVADIIIASHQASFSLPEARFGLTPSIAIGCLLERIKPHHIKQLVWRQKKLSATEALEWGLVDILTTPETLTHSVSQLSNHLSRLSSAVITQSKRLLESMSSFEQRLDDGGYLLRDNLCNSEVIKKIGIYLDDIKWIAADDADEKI